MTKIYIFLYLFFIRLIDLGVLRLKKRWIIGAAVFILITIALHIFLYLYGIEHAKLLSDNTYQLQQIHDGILRIAGALFTLILLLTATALISFNMDRRRDAEIFLSNNLKILEGIINATGDGILVVDTNKKVLKINDLFFKMWDIPSDTCSFSDARDYLSFVSSQIKDFDIFHAWLDSSCKSCTTDNYLIYLFDGRIINVYFCPLLDKDNLIGRVWSFKDTTAQVNTEYELAKSNESIKLILEALEYDKIKTEIFANMSHEVKTPLNIIIGTLHLIELNLNNENNITKSDKLERYTTIMRRNCYRLLRTLNNLIFVTEIDSGYVGIYAQNNDLVKIVKDIVSGIEKIVERKGIKLDLSIDQDSLIIACDADKIERVLLNLISNAVKFTEIGGKISISLCEKDKYAYISVKDTGIGIPDEMKESIFQRFRQVDKSFTRKCEGSGIGLYLAKSLVEMHEGTIEVQSEYGEGSEFVVKLPLKLSEEDEIAATVEDTPNIFKDRINIEFSDIY